MRANQSMDKRHAADCNTYIPVEAKDADEFRPWVSHFLRGGMTLLGKSLPAGQSKELQKTLREFDDIPIGAGKSEAESAPPPRARANKKR